MDVHQILAPNTDPHDYEPRPDDVTNTADAKIVFTNGDNLDSWMDKVVSDSGSDAKVVDLGAAVPVKLPGESSGPEASQYDPHWWHDPRNAEEAVRQIATQLSAVDPQGQAAPSRPTPPPTRRSSAVSTAGSRAASTRFPPPTASWSPTTTRSTTSPSRYGIQVVGAVIPSQTTQAQPNAEDLSESRRSDSQGGRQGDLPGELAEPQAGGDDRL